jgi:hypothetical protein
MATYITFNEPTVLQHLIDKGEVYTIRFYPVDKGTKKLIMRDDRLLGFHISLETVAQYKTDGELNDELLKQYYKESGFDSADEWKRAIKLRHRNRPNLWVIKAVIVDNPMDFDEVLI